MKLAIIYAVAIHLVICTMYVIQRFFICSWKGVHLEFYLITFIPAFVAGRREPFADVVV